MKAKHLFGLSIIMMMAVGTLVLSGSNVAVSMRDNTPILIHHNPTNPMGEPRTPVNNPFFAELLEGSGYVQLGVTTPCGVVSVQITSTAGDTFFTYFNTSTGSILLPISGDAGDYTLLITMADGIQFIGEFTL